MQFYTYQHVEPDELIRRAAHFPEAPGDGHEAVAHEHYDDHEAVGVGHRHHETHERLRGAPIRRQHVDDENDKKYKSSRVGYGILLQRINALNM